jgi:hypothetical protein
MSIRQLSPAVITTASLILAACGPAIRAARDEAIPIPQGASWAWGPREPQGAAVPGDEIVLQRFQRAVAEAMLAKGFREVEAPPPRRLDVRRWVSVSSIPIPTTLVAIRPGVAP